MQGHWKAYVVRDLDILCRSQGAQEDAQRLFANVTYGPTLGTKYGYGRSATTPTPRWAGS